MIIVHHLNNSRSQRVLWLLEEASAWSTRSRRYQRDPKTMLAPPSLVPCILAQEIAVITDGALTLAESAPLSNTWSIAGDTGSRRRPVRRNGCATPIGCITRRLGDASAAAEADLSIASRPAPMPFFARPIARAIAGRAKARSSSRRLRCI
jgi:glutathione S-transferase